MGLPRTPEKRLSGKLGTYKYTNPPMRKLRSNKDEIYNKSVNEGQNNIFLGFSHSSQSKNKQRLIENARRVDEISAADVLKRVVEVEEERAGLDEEDRAEFVSELVSDERVGMDDEGRDGFVSGERGLNWIVKRGLNWIVKRGVDRMMTKELNWVGWLD